MIHEVVPGAVSIVAIVAAAYVETHAGDPDAYLYVALGAGGYAAGAVASKSKKRKSR